MCILKFYHFSQKLVKLKKRYLIKNSEIFFKNIRSSDHFYYAVAVPIALSKSAFKKGTQETEQHKRESDLNNQVCFRGGAWKSLPHSPPIMWGRRGQRAKTGEGSEQQQCASLQLLKLRRSIRATQCGARPATTPPSRLYYTTHEWLLSPLYSLSNYDSKSMIQMISLEKIRQIPMFTFKVRANFCPLRFHGFFSVQKIQWPCSCCWLCARTSLGRFYKCEKFID